MENATVILQRLRSLHALCNSRNAGKRDGATSIHDSSDTPKTIARTDDHARDGDRDVLWNVDV
jgi:hypothetical protein